MKLNSIKEFNKSLQLTKKTFFTSGVEVEASTKKNYYLATFMYYFNLWWLYSDAFGEVYWVLDGIRVGKGLDELSLVAPCATFCFMVTIKVTPFFLNRQILHDAIQKLRDMHPEEADPEDDEGAIVIKTHTFLKSVVTLFFVSAFVVLVMFSVEPFLLMAYEYHQTHVFELKFPFLIKYFFNPYTNLMTWAFVYFHQVWSTVIVCVNLFAADSLFYIFCTYLRMHFLILGHRFKNVVCDSREETRERLRRCVDRHKELIALVNLLETLYSKSTLFNVMSSTLLLCLNGFNIMVVQTTSAVVTYGPFLVWCLFQVYLICSFGELLMSSSIELSDAVYSCRWYDADMDFRKSILIIILRCHQPCKVTAANFSDLNLNAFTTIMSRSWSCFALLKTMYT